MAKVKKAYFCSSCGNEASKWLGRCPACGEWNTFVEEVLQRESASPSAVLARMPAGRPVPVGQIKEEHHRRIDGGESVDEVAADAAERAQRAFGLIEKGLNGYAVKA